MNEPARDNPADHDDRLIAAARREADACAAAAGRPSQDTTRGSSADGYALLPDPTPDSFAGYQILGEVHRGGQGVVYRARQPSTGREVAIKVLREGPFAGTADKARFDREVQILRQLNHPDIVAIHDTGEAAGHFYYVMDYIAGHALDSYLPDQRTSVAETLRLFARICEAVNAAHLRGVIHRDLKPGNIRVDAAGQPHILDFGLAKVANAAEATTMTVKGQFVGSLPWASPEQAEGAPEKIDIRTDVYSLGVILYHMLTGCFPYDVTGNMRDVLDRILHAVPVRPRLLRRDLDDDVETIVLKCLAKERDRRYQSAGEIARDAQRHLDGKAIEAKRDSAWYVLCKTLRRHRLAVAIAVVFLVAGWGTGGVMSALYYRARAAADEARREAVAAQESLRHNAELDDVRDVPIRDCLIAGDPHQRYFLIGPRPPAPARPGGYRLLIVLPGGDGGPEFASFVRRICRFALPDGYLVAEAVAPRWSDTQLERLTWPTRTNPLPEMEFATEDFVAAIVGDVAQRAPLDGRYLLLFGWSSGGPPCYATALADRSPITGALIAMSVFRPAALPALTNARGRSFAILQSPDDNLVPPQDAQAALAALQANGAQVRLIATRGPHGWGADTYTDIRTALDWLEEQVNRAK